MQFLFNKRVATLLSVAICIIATAITACTKPADENGSDKGDRAVIVSTLQASEITAKSATCEGIIVRDNGWPILEKGVCYSFTVSPTVSDHIMVGSEQLPNFTCTLNDLDANKKYFVRAYVKTVNGYFYGNEITFTTSAQVTVVAPNGTLYLGGFTHELFALDAATGAVKWTAKTGRPFCSQPLYTRGRVIVSGSDDYLYSFDTLGNLQWKVRLKGQAVTDADADPIRSFGLRHGAISIGNVIYTQDYDYFYAVEANTGAIIWDHKKTSEVRSGPYGRTSELVYENNMIYVTTGSELRALDPVTGKSKWEAPYYNGGTPYVSRDRLYGVASTGIIQVYNSLNGELIWKEENYKLMKVTCLAVKFGKIYTDVGDVYDSATAKHKYFTMDLLSYLYPYHPDGRPMIVTDDGLAISTWGVYDAHTGDFICRGQAADDVMPSGTTYAGNSIIFYASEQTFRYGPNGIGWFYSSVHAYDIKTKSLLWIKSIENANFAFQAPVFVTPSGVVYRGGNVFH